MPIKGAGVDQIDPKAFEAAPEGEPTGEAAEDAKQHECCGGGCGCDHGEDEGGFPPHIAAILELCAPPAFTGTITAENVTIVEVGKVTFSSH
ncbi:MAG: hypothetical protein ACK5MU_00790 [Candidatus Saccharimonadales bacterium]